MILEAKYLRTKMIEELYIGMLFLASIFTFIIPKHVSVNSLHVRIFVSIFIIYLLGYSINLISKLYFKDEVEDITPKFILSFIDGIFLTIFLYITRDHIHILEPLFMIYIIFQSIRFYDRNKLVFSLYTTFCYMSLLVIEDPKSILSLNSFLNVVFFFVIGQYCRRPCIERSLGNYNR